MLLRGRGGTECLRWWSRVESCQVPFTATLYTLDGDAAVFSLVTGGSKTTEADVVVFDELLSVLQKHCSEFSAPFQWVWPVMYGTLSAQILRTTFLIC